MKRKQFLLVGALILATLLVSGIALAQDGGSQIPLDPAEDLTTATSAANLQSALSTSFTYQGRLDKDGSPVDDACDMRFKLYDAASAGTEVGSDPHAGVPVTDGLFSVNLDFGADAFTGDRRWLGIEVDCEEDSTYDDLGRQELTAAPYALSLKPGAVISGTNTSGAILRVENAGGGAGDFAVYAKSTGGYGVYGSSQTNRGVYGSSQSSHGVEGKSTDGYGVYGESKNDYGVYAAGAGGDLGLYDGSIHAVRESGSDMTLYSNDDVYVHLDNNDSNPVKVYSEFQIINGSGTTVFSVAENGAVSWYTETGYVSIPAAAFRPRQDGYDFRNLGTQLINDDGNSDYYVAPVQLPHGATVTKMTFYYSDSSASNASASLRRTNLSSGLFDTMASVDSQGDSGFGDTVTTAIDPNTIDNYAAAYFLRWMLPDSDTIGIAVLIEYTYTGPH
jgi:hypothetical protein